MSKPMSVRKFAEQNVPKLASKKSMIDAGYFSVELRPYDFIDNYQSAQQWCSKNFKNKHWCFYYNRWWFTREDDAILFRLTWT